MSEKTIREAINEALRQEMNRDPSVVVFGEDVAGGAGLAGESMIVQTMVPFVVSEQLGCRRPVPPAYLVHTRSSQGW